MDTTDGTEAQGVNRKRQRTLKDRWTLPPRGRGQNGNTGEQGQSSGSFPGPGFRTCHHDATTVTTRSPPESPTGVNSRDRESEYVRCGTNRVVTAQIIDGKAVALQIEKEVAAAIAGLGFRPGLVAVRVGNDPASEIYVRNKARKARELGLAGTELVFPDTMSERELLAEVERLNRDETVDGILVQLPLPKQIDARKVIDAISPAKDVDGFHPINVGMMHLGRPALVPCTPAGVMRLIESTGQAIEGKHAVVIGRSDIVGKPMAALLLQKNATVTICHSRTRDLPAVARQGDILVAAIGRPIFVTDDFVKPGAIVIDVGMNRVGPEFAERLAHDAEKSRLLAKNETALLGDVDYARVREVASWITPVPGGVGPMTIAMLMQNTVTAAQRRRA
jgi:methylenetetrahydrofolate dehydrogenase (NADP+)/methenyltetrahydrofolate cyclohydrolase